MPNYTNNLKLEKPLSTDNYDINVSNSNMDKIDLEVKKLQDNKSNNGHTHTKANITDFAHTHSMGEITGLSLEWDAIKNKPISSSITSTSTTDIANSNAVKLVNDKVEANKTSILNLQNADGNLSQLQTSNKSNLVGAINELFQNANNGKSTIATAVGSPLSSGDTFSAMGSKIDTLTSKFKTNLNAKGVSTSSADKMSNLIDKVGTIATGKKWAEGVATDKNISSIWSGVATYRVPFSLDFSPSEIVLNVGSISVNGTDITTNISINSKYSYSSSKRTVVTNNTSPTKYLRFYINNISDSGFDICVSSSDSSTMKNLTWEAYE